MKAVWWAGAAALAMWGGTAQAAPDEAGCKALATSGWLTGGTVTAAEWKATDTAAFCEVQATLKPTPGSDIGVVYRMPANWNGKLLGLGGGGWAGNVRPESAAEGLTRGYAVAQTDGGHTGPNVWDTTWTADADKATDFAYRAIHEMTVAGKQVVQRYYGKPQSKAYFQGCSTGGRMALMEAQRFPADYDGIIAGAPVYTLQVQTSAVLRGNTFAKPGAAFTQAQLKLAQDAVLAACDATDGQKDGIIAAPRQCKWNPATLACKGGASGDQCLAPAQVDALRVAYDGIKASDGRWAAFPMSRGGEAGWSRFVGTNGKPDPTGGGGLGGLKPLLWGTRDVDLTRLDPNRDVAEARASAFAKMYEAGDPNLDAFVKRGGKLILWHGESDPGPSPVGTADYYDAVAKRSAATAKDGVRLFLAPGVEHCIGGPGPDRLDTISALEDWAEQGRAPVTLAARSGDGRRTRALCPYPATAHYKGGDENLAASYECR